MYKYSFTNDLRTDKNIDKFLNNLKDVAEKVERNVLTKDMPTKGERNNFTATRFYMNVGDGNNNILNCGRVLLNGNPKQVLYNFIKKFQYPNLRTKECLETSIQNSIEIVPLRTMLKILMLDYLQEGEESYITKDELRENIILNRKVAENINCNLAEVLGEIKAVRSGKQKAPDVNYNGYKIEDRHFNEFITLLEYAKFIKYKDNTKKEVMINVEGMNDDEKKALFDIISDNNFLECTQHTTLAEYQEYMDIEYYEEKIDFHEKMKNVRKEEFPFNRIIFGAPGTGKSNRIKNDSINFGDNFERVTFYPNYSYAQFVGTYKPKPLAYNSTEITYSYVPGPFLRILTEAYRSLIEDHEPKNYLLIIEEINRANAAAVFGDVFQLLDRKNGVSEYEISTSEDMQEYMSAELGKSKDNFKTLKIPNNMYIWATMNSADQGVLPLDTAFKRRWSFEYMDIDKGESANNIDVTLKEGQTIEWNKLRHAINKKLGMIPGVNEDKMLGPFFLNENDLKNNFTEAFKSKVLMYLYEDVVKLRKNEFFKDEIKTYSDLIKQYDSVGGEIFKFKLEYKNSDQAED